MSPHISVYLPYISPISPYISGSVGALFWVGVLCGWLLRLQVP